VRYVAPVLDPTWQNPYAPTSAEKHLNHRTVRTFALKRMIPQMIIVTAVVITLLILGVVSLWLALAGVAIGVFYAWDLRRGIVRYENRGRTLGGLVLESFAVGGTSSDFQRLTTVLDRLAATFGVDNATPYIIEDPIYNAALVPSGHGFSLFVTDALMRDYDLIELEGVVAHCLARHRLGLLTRESLASVITMNDEARRALAGSGWAYRADEVAAAAIRYPLGIAGALRRCEGQEGITSAFFNGESYAQWRWVWFNVWSDRSSSELSDLDDVEA
jgi:hypothetical protein